MNDSLARIVGTVRGDTDTDTIINLAAGMRIWYLPWIR